jgi:hypothetical protein
MMNINPEAYYFLPAIFNTYRDEYDGDKHIKEWYDFIVTKHLGVVPYVSPYARMNLFNKDSLISDYYRIVDLKLFFITSLQLNIVVDDETPTIPQTIHGVVPFPRGNLVP